MRIMSFIVDVACMNASTIYQMAHNIGGKSTYERKKFRRRYLAG
jgi:hypothetical protein